MGMYESDPRVDSATYALESLARNSISAERQLSKLSAGDLKRMYRMSVSKLAHLLGALTAGPGTDSELNDWGQDEVAAAQRKMSLLVPFISWKDPESQPPYTDGLSKEELVAYQGRLAVLGAFDVPLQDLYDSPSLRFSLPPTP